MASGSRVPAEKTVPKSEGNDPEIDAMALQIQETHRKYEIAKAKQQADSKANVYINRHGKRQRLANLPNKININNNKDLKILSKDLEFRFSIKGKFCWKSIAEFHVPCIIRKINGEYLKFVSVRVAETQLLRQYKHNIHKSVIYSCTLVKSYFISNSEAKLLNEINFKHADCKYGNTTFDAGKECIVRLEDVLEFYTFASTCYKKLRCEHTSALNEKCGFIRINDEIVVPYCTQDGKKLLPIFYFEGATDELTQNSIKIENWNLAYLKFCCRVQRIKEELYPSNFCTMVSLDNVKEYYSPETRFEEYWPSRLLDSKFLTNENLFHPTEAWIRAPPEVVPTENNIPYSLIEPEQAVPQSIPVTMNTYQNVGPANQMINTYITQPEYQLPSTSSGFYSKTIHQNTEVQCKNEGSKISQGSSFISGANYVVWPTPLVSPVVLTNTTSLIDNTVSYSSIAPSNQIMRTVSNPMKPVNYNNQSQQQFQQQRKQQRQQQPQTSNIPQTQQAYRGQSVHFRGPLINTRRQRNPLRNVVRKMVIPPDSEIIDLSSPPESPVPPSVQQSSHIGIEFMRIPETKEICETSRKSAYKIQNLTLNGKLIHCINYKPYIYSDLLVTLNDLVLLFVPQCPLERFALILTKCLNTKLHVGNTDQTTVLMEHGRLSSVYQRDTPMARLQDIIKVLPQLIAMGQINDEEIQRYQSAGGPFKIQQPREEWAGHCGNQPGCSKPVPGSSTTSNYSTTISRYSATEANSNDWLNAGTD